MSFAPLYIVEFHVTNKGHCAYNILKSMYFIIVMQCYILFYEVRIDNSILVIN